MIHNRAYIVIPIGVRGGKGVVQDKLPGRKRTCQTVDPREVWGSITPQLEEGSNIAITPIVMAPPGREQRAQAHETGRLINIPQ